MPDCKNCIHIEVCKSADSCDGRVPGCRHFEPKPKHGRWVIHSNGKRASATSWAECSECLVCGSPTWKVCPVCETKMDLPRITDQTMKAYGGGNDMWYIIAFIIGAWFGIGIMAVVGIAKGD